MAIGTENEQQLHRELKYYFEPDESKHEKKVGRYIADILNDTGIIEVQTGSFDKIRKRIAFFLEQYSVTIVFPVAVEKMVAWIDPETGECTKPRKSPRKGDARDVLPQLFWLLPQLSNSRLSIKVALMDMEEHKLLCGWSADRKRGARRIARIPVEPRGFVTLSEKADYGPLLPPGLPVEFTAKEFCKAARFSDRKGGQAIKVLLDREVIFRTGKRKNAFLYVRAEDLQKGAATV